MTTTEISYGKAQVVFYRLGGHDIAPLAASVDVDVFGERFGAAYTEGDNREVVATDTMKNFVYATAADFVGGSPDEYVLFLGRRLLGTYPQMERIRVTAHEVPLDPAHHITPMGRTGYSPPPAGAPRRKRRGLPITAGRRPAAGGGLDAPPPALLAAADGRRCARGD